MPAPVFISWSGLQRHERCRQSHYLAKKSKMGRPAGTDIRNFVHGTVADRVVRKWLTEETNHKPGQMAEYVEDIFQLETTPKTAGGNAEGVVKWRNVQDRDKLQEFVRELVTNCEPYLFKYVIPYEWEADFSFKTPVVMPYLDGSPAEVTLVGYMDILVRRSREPDTWYGIDLKATTDDYYVNKTLGQVVFYDIALLNMFGRPAEQWVFLQPATKTPWLPIDVSNDDRVQMLSRIHRMATLQWQKDYSPREDTKECTRCEVKAGCVKYKPTIAADGTKKLGFGSRT